MAVTHDIIAKKLQINRTTVTKALKGDDSIKKDTRKKVLETAALLGYDFKQSQQNRREGKRYFVREKVTFSFLDPVSKEVLVNGEGVLTSLSTTGLLLKLERSEGYLIPMHQSLVKITGAESIEEYSEIPLARVVRVNYQSKTECAGKFDEDVAISKELLEIIESQSFEKVDRA
ncbi:MAG: helix-turn-helix domain-containing protein [Planctomycetes bacterium]|nr:helix-turn-helix domain-containing protein [Planctomycetota bacterium]